MEQKCLYADPSPYPEIKVCSKNAGYAKAMLSNIGSCNSEISAITLYVYNSIALSQEEEEAADSFRQVSIVEMRHLDIFGKLALLLGEDPRLWSRIQGSRVYWSPRCNSYFRDLPNMLNTAIEGENEAIAKYTEQKNWIEDPFIVANLDRILLDEYHHLEIFNRLKML